MYMTVKEAAAKWGISDRRIRVLCSEGKIPGAYQEGRGWKIPIDAEKPADGRLSCRIYFAKFVAWCRTYLLLRIVRHDVRGRGRKNVQKSAKIR